MESKRLKLIKNIVNIVFIIVILLSLFSIYFDFNSGHISLLHLPLTDIVYQYGDYVSDSDYSYGLYKFFITYFQIRINGTGPSFTIVGLIAVTFVLLDFFDVPIKEFKIVSLLSFCLKFMAWYPSVIIPSLKNFAVHFICIVLLFFVYIPFSVFDYVHSLKNTDYTSYFKKRIKPFIMVLIFLVIISVWVAGAAHMVIGRYYLPSSTDPLAYRYKECTLLYSLISGFGLVRITIYFLIVWLITAKVIVNKKHKIS